VFIMLTDRGHLR